MANKFEYKYNAPTQAEKNEINEILKDYLPKDNKISKIDELRKLHFKVKNIPMILGLSFGIIGSLIFGLGLACVLEWEKIVLGIIISCIGLIIISVAYPIYNIIYKHLKNKYSERIIKLSNELLNINE